MAEHSYSDEAKDIIRRMEIGDEVILEAYGRTLNYFEVYDALENTTHVRYIKSVFEERISRKSVDGLAIGEYCAERTLYRYIHKYVDCIMFFVSKLTKQ